MLHLTVGAVPDADFSTISEALLAVPYHLPATLHIGAGVYSEKVFCEKQHIVLQGAGQGKTVLTWDDAAQKHHPDGREYGTFRSYTAFFGGGYVRVADMTVQNTAGAGADVGQAVAAYVDASLAHFQNVELLGRQDTLFCAPLPQEAPQVKTFIGPRQFAPVAASRQLYERCRIAGDVDFIFGGADAVFTGCEIFQHASRNRTSYIAAPCGGADGLGLVFHHCRVTGDAGPEDNCWLGRPWRPYGKAAFLQCALGHQLNPEGWDPWGKEENKATATFAEWENTGPGAGPRPGWIHQLEPGEAENLLDCVKKLKQELEAIAL